MCTLIKKISNDMKDISLKDAGLYHGANIVYCNDDSEIFDNNYIKVGKEFEPINMKFYFNGSLFELATFGGYLIKDLKEILSKKIKISENDFEISFLSSNKQIYLKGDILLDKTTQKEKTIKDLKLNNKNYLTISLNKDIKINDEEENKLNEKENLISCIVKFENNLDSVKLIKINPEKTFLDLYELVEKEFPEISEKKSQNLDENQKFGFRLFEEINNKILSKSLFDKKINTYPVFLEDSVRLNIEIGEIYDDNEISLTILMNDKQNKESIIEKEFICDPQKYTITKIKKFLLDNFIMNDNNSISDEEKNKLYNNYILYEVNMFNEPEKPFKNEELSLENCKIKNHDIIFIKNISDIPNEIVYINIYYSNKELSFYDLLEIYEPFNLNDEKNYDKKLELKFLKKLLYRN